MTWNQAIEDTLGAWYGIRDSIGLDSDLEVLTEIHAACALCARAAEAAGDPARRCERCPLAQQFGLCYGIGGEMSERIAERDLAGLAELVDEFIDRLEAVQPPREAETASSDPDLCRYVEML